MAGKITTVRNGKKRCSDPKHVGERWLPLSDFQDDRSQPTGKKSKCRDCYNFIQQERREKNPEASRADSHARHKQNTAAADQRDEALIARADRDARKAAAEAELRERRLASDTEPLKPDDFSPEDFDVTVGNVPGEMARRASANASKHKRQEYNAKMGQHAAAVRQASLTEAQGDGDMVDAMPAADGTYIGALAEQERRFGNRRLARSISLFAANEEQARRLFIATAKQYFADKVVPVGYARKPSRAPIKRSVCLMLSDLHIGSDLSGADNPSQFGAVEEARRLEYVLRQCLDYKPQYREHSELVLMWNGDLIEGLLQHGHPHDGAPLAEQKAALWSYGMSFIGACSAAFPRVRLFWKPGNHGRDKVRHEGRATSRKWDGHEWEMGFAMQMATRSLKNVAWEVDSRGVLDRQPQSIIDLHGSNFLLTHADTEIKLGDPDTKAKENFAQLSSINSTLRYGKRCDAFGFGHYHKGRYQIGEGIRILWNGALVPPNGHARASGYGESCGQWLWEAVEGYPVGDVRFIEVGRSQDRDEKLGSIIRPFRFDLQ